MKKVTLLNKKIKIQVHAQDMVPSRLLQRRMNLTQARVFGLKRAMNYQLRMQYFRITIHAYKKLTTANYGSAMKSKSPIQNSRTLELEWEEALKT